MNQYKQVVKSFFAALTLSLLCLVGGGPAVADSGIQSVAQSYGSASSLQTGLIVQINGKNNNQVVADTYATAAKMQGVVVSANAAPVTLSSTSSTSNQVFIASSGRYEVLVSSQGGTIASGDYITVSSLAGVGMKAGGQSEVLGRAAAAFDGQHNVDSTTSLRDENGRTVSVALGRIPVDINIGANPLASKDGGYVPNFLQRAVQIVTNRPVSAWRIYVAVLVLLVASITGASLMYGGVRSGMVAIGRNPLARRSIMRSLFQVIVTSLVIFVLGLFATYFILKI